MTLTLLTLASDLQSLFQMPRAISHYCQKCRAANELGQEFCQRCGTRLMIVVEPPSVRIDVSSTTPHEEHLLERMTMLENTLARLAERLEHGLKLLLRQSETAYNNHALVKSLIEMLNECGVVDNGRLESMWRAECKKLKESPSEPRTKERARKTTKAKRKPTTSG
jgi:zinc-ribbon domain